jgi:hypothetical protein
MPYPDAQRYAFVYIQQDIVDEGATYYLRLHNQAFAPMIKNKDLSKLSPADLDKLIDGCSLTITQEQLLYYLALGLDRNYTHALTAR